VQITGTPSATKGRTLLLYNHFSKEQKDVGSLGNYPAVEDVIFGLSVYYSPKNCKR